MNLVDRCLLVRQALLTPSAPLLEQQLDVHLQRGEWERRNGRSLADVWHAITYPDGRTRYLKESPALGESSWQRPRAVEIEVTFMIRPEASPVSDWLRTYGTSTPPETAEVIAAAVDAAAPGFNLDTIRSLAFSRMPRSWGLSWPSPEQPPIEELRFWLLDQRNGYAIDGALMSAVTTVVELYERVAAKAPADVARVAEPLATGNCTSGVDLLQRTALSAAAAGHLPAVYHQFVLYTDLAATAVQEILEASDLDGFYDLIYQYMPMTIAAVELGNILKGTPLPDEPTRQVDARHRTVEEIRVRLLEAVIARVRNLIGEDVAWREQVRRLRAQAAGNTRTAERLATRMIEQRYLYPRSWKTRLITAATEPQ